MQWAALLVAGAPQAVVIDTGTDVKVRWDNKVKYSAAYRTNGSDPRLSGAANAARVGRSAR